MPIAKITRQGLAAIALSVALLWGCIIVEHLQQRDAFVERARVMRELQLLQRPAPKTPLQTPVSVPSLVPLRPHVSAG
jgi:hypothetical protein